MGKPWNGTIEQHEVIREISKYPVGTEPTLIFNNFDSQTWEALKSANRINGKTKEWSVYRMLCRMLKDPEILKRAEELKNNQTSFETSVNIQNEIDKIYEDEFYCFKLEMEKALDAIGQKIFNRIKSRIDKLSTN